MARKKKPEPAPPSQAYLVSFGDCMTALLAFFIVLVSLAKEQTGANLYSGTGSFVKATKEFGVPGNYYGDRSDRAVQLNEASPLYIIDDPDNPDKTRGQGGPDDENNPGRIIDRDEDELMRFLNELQHNFTLEEKKVFTSDVVIDLFERFGKTDKDFLNPKTQTVLKETVGMIVDPKFKYQIIVWATTPAPTAIKRAVIQAEKVRNRVISEFQIQGEMKSRVTAVGKPWRFSDAKRPVLSIHVEKAM